MKTSTERSRERRRRQRDELLQEVLQLVDADVALTWRAVAVFLTPAGLRELRAALIAAADEAARPTRNRPANLAGGPPASALKQETVPMALNCDVCESAEAAFIVSLTETGDTSYQCPGCYARLGLEAAKRILPPEEIAATIGPLFVEGGQQPGRGGNARRSRKSKAAAAEEPKPGEQAAEGLEGPQAAASDS